MFSPLLRYSLILEFRREEPSLDDMKIDRVVQQPLAASCFKSDTGPHGNPSQLQCQTE